MPAKDYYRILHSDPSASDQEIKKAYRKLVLKYHPDKNPTNPFAENHFREIQEAYEILSHPEKRRKYNQERWFTNGNFKNYNGGTIETILAESRKLRQYAAKMDIFRMDHNSMHHHLMLILSDSHLSTLIHLKDHNAIYEVVRNTLITMTNLKFNLIREPAEKLLTLSEGQPELKDEINVFLSSRKRKNLWQRRKPLIVLLLTILLCLLIFIASGDQ